MISPARRNPEYGRGTHTIEDDPDDGEVERLATFLDEMLESNAVKLPRPPTVALEIHELSRRVDADIGKIAALLGREPVLAAQVLKLANSAMYRGEMPSATLKEALMRVGLAAARDIVMEAAMHMTIIRAEGMNATLERVRRHSSGVAWLSRAVARNTALEAENAFLVGLLHDIGLSVGLMGAAEYLRRLREPVRLTPRRWLVVNEAHARLGGKVLARWNVGPALTYVVAHHDQLVIEGRAHPSVAVLQIAEQIAREYEWDVTPTVEGEDLPIVASAGNPDDTDRALQALNLTLRHYEILKQDAGRTLEMLGGQFQG